MKLLEISYRKVKNLGNYESEELRVSGAPTDDQTARELIAELKSLVDSELSGQGPTEFNAKVEVAEKPAKKTKAAPKAKEVVEPEEEAAVVEEEPVPEEDVVKPSKKLIKPAAKKNTPYTKAKEFHKKLLGNFLTANYPSWKKDARVKAKAATLSDALSGKDFLDADGEMLSSFEALVNEIMK